jgi:hypothetical protein
MIRMAGEPVRKNGRQPSVQALHVFSTDASVSKGKARPVLAALVLKEGAEKFSHKGFTVRWRGVNAARSA